MVITVHDADDGDEQTLEILSEPAPGDVIVIRDPETHKTLRVVRVSKTTDASTYETEAVAFVTSQIHDATPVRGEELN